MAATRDEVKLQLLKSLLTGPKLFDIKRCSVNVIDLAFEMSAEGLVRIHDKRISLTPKGKQRAEVRSDETD